MAVHKCKKKAHKDEENLNISVEQDADFVAWIFLSSVRKGVSRSSAVPKTRRH